VSISVATNGQAETDRLWTALTANGGEENHCGWLKDRYGVSWQITPTALLEMIADKDPEKSRRTMKAMLTMKKLDVEVLKKAYDGR